MVPNTSKYLVGRNRLQNRWWQSPARAHSQSQAADLNARWACWQPSNGHFGSRKRSWSCRHNRAPMTLLFTATDKKRVIVGQLGDGGIGLITDKARLAFQIPKGEFANQTYFTTSPSAAEHLQLALLPITDLQGIILFSDGTAQSLIENKSNTFASAAATMVGWRQSNSATVVQEALRMSPAQSFAVHVAGLPSMPAQRPPHVHTIHQNQAAPDPHASAWPCVAPCATVAARSEASPTVSRQMDPACFAASAFGNWAQRCQPAGTS